MRRLIPQNEAQRTGILLLGATIAAFALPLAAQGQNPAQNDNPHAAHSPAQPVDAGKDLTAQLRELKAKVATLEATLQKRSPGAAGRPMMGGKGMVGDKNMGMGMMGMGGMEGMDRDQMMTMMQQMMQMMGGMKGMEGGKPGMSGMEMMGGKGMQMMGGMKSMSGMPMPSALPGFPGASHIYHVGATGFFLDHPEHITLSAEQQAALNRIKEQTLLEQATSERRIEEVEQELWKLTASDQPDAAKIETKVREIEKLRTDQRLAFIRAVGEAAKLLTDEQRMALLGTGASEQPDTQDRR